MGKRSNGEGSVVKRKDGRWCAAYTVGGKRKYLYGKTRKEVVGKLRETLAESDGACYPDIEVRDYLGRWLEDSVKESVRARTYERYESIVRVHIKPSMGRVKLKALTPAQVRALYREKLVQLSPRSVNYVHVTLHKALKQAVLDGLIPRNVADAVKPPQARGEEIRPLSPAQAARLLSAARGERLEALYVVAVHAGLRQGELLGLKWPDLDLEGGTLSVQRSLAADRSFNPPKPPIRPLGPGPNLRFSQAQAAWLFTTAHNY